MGKINWGRVILGGLMIGLVANQGHGVLWFLTSKQWAPILQPHVASVMEPGQLNPKPGFMLTFAVALFVLGIIMLWLYAAIRPRYGPGPKTAAIAGFAIWLILALADVIWVPMSGFPVEVAAISIPAYLPIFILAAMAGAWVYREPAQAAE
jgi:hypothetical protein